MNNNDTVPKILSSASTSRNTTRRKPSENFPSSNAYVMCYTMYELCCCGEDGCIYSNNCFARNENYNITKDCVKFNKVDNIPTSVPCKDGRFDSPTPLPTMKNENNQTVTQMNNNDTVPKILSSVSTTRYATGRKPLGNCTNETEENTVTEMEFVSCVDVDMDVKV